jgi:hypothetical protein
VIEPALLTFIRSSLRSVWALELLLLLRRTSPNTLGIKQAARELRASDTLVAKLLPQLEAAGLVVGEGDAYRFAPASPALQELCGLLEQEYRERPVAVVDAIIAKPDKVQSLADAFRFKRKDE